MALKLLIAPYRLLFQHPFGTAHGLRDGTDAVFVKIERNGLTGFGEATMPPYVTETSETVIDALARLDLKLLEQGQFKFNGTVGPCARACISSAYYDLVSREKNISIGSLLDVTGATGRNVPSLITLGVTDLVEIPERLVQLPRFNALKIKLNGTDDLERMNTVLQYDQRPILIDANQAWTSVEHALSVVELIGNERLLGLEQPFPVERLDLQKEFITRSSVIVLGDESIKTMEDLEALAGIFSGVNLKLMKCGGSDMAAAMAEKAIELGLKVMLGSMSESSLGCGALLHLAPMADLVDLDGPWLIRNDPFTGLALEQGTVRFQDDLGRVELKSPSRLNWTPIGA